MTYFRIRTVKENRVLNTNYIKLNPYTVDLNITENLPNSIKEQRHRVFGKCYTFIAERDIKDFGVYYIKIKLYVSISEMISF